MEYMSSILFISSIKVIAEQNERMLSRMELSEWSVLKLLVLAIWTVETKNKTLEAQQEIERIVLSDLSLDIINRKHITMAESIDITFLAKL